MASREYPTVLAASINKHDLLSAHATAITQEQAMELIFSYLDEDEVCCIRFVRDSMSGWAHPNGTMTLPKEPTKGIVLHEVAHFIQFKESPIKSIEGKRVVHGSDFTAILDRLIKSEIEWQNHPYTEDELFSNLQGARS